MQLIQAKEVAVSGRFLRKLTLRSEVWEFVESPDAFVAELQKTGSPRADILSFVDRIDARPQRFPYQSEPEPIAAIELDSYERWFKEQINSKTRNMVRKASARGV